MVSGASKGKIIEKQVPLARVAQANDLKFCCIGSIHQKKRHLKDAFWIRLVLESVAQTIGTTLSSQARNIAVNR